ncbi:MAG TPA: hypothetical protein V6C65_04615 [Allocoleopsis sp.]
MIQSAIVQAFQNETPITLFTEGQVFHDMTILEVDREYVRFCEGEAYTDDENDQMTVAWKFYIFRLDAIIGIGTMAGASLSSFPEDESQFPDFPGC